MRVTRAIVLTFAALLAGCSVNGAIDDRFSATGELIALSGADAGAASACITCHGLDGGGDGAGAPRLAALDAGYLQRQLEAYADGRRDHAQMAWIAKRLDDRERAAVSAYYAAMPADARGGEMPREMSALYHVGAPKRGILACAVCHGTQGQGIGPANPPLAGQPAPYLAEQLRLWRVAKRRNDPGDVMLRISQLLTPAEADALARYAAALPGGPPSREFRATSLAGHRADPRNDASAPPLHVPESARAAE